MREALINATKQSVSLFDSQSFVRCDEGRRKKLKVSKHILFYCKCNYCLLSNNYQVIIVIIVTILSVPSAPTAVCISEMKLRVKASSAYPITSHRDKTAVADLT